MRFHVLTLFPQMIEQGLSESITGRALKQNIISLNTVNIRDFAHNKHNKVDDYTYGGGAGMLMQAEPVYQAVRSVMSQINKCNQVHSGDNSEKNIADENILYENTSYKNTAEEIKKKLEENAYNSSIYIAVDTLEYLKKGGRVTAAGAAIGAVLNIKPVLTIQGEKLDAFTKVRGMKKAELKMLEAIEEDLNTRFADVDRKQLRLGAAGTFQKQEDADQWYKMVKDTFENEIHDIYYDPLSFSIGCHVGPNAIGIGISVVTRDEK